jgi:hypothetical protein
MPDPQAQQPRAHLIAQVLKYSIAAPMIPMSRRDWRRPTYAQDVDMYRLIALLLGIVLIAEGRAATLDPALQPKLDAKIMQFKAWAAEPVLIAAIKAQNAGKSAEASAMTQAQWQAATVLDPFVRSLTKNATAELLKSKRSDDVAEAFVSSADGTKVAFLSKPTNWSHKGKAKHDTPMNGTLWQGEVEVDESTGLQQIQVSVPVLDGGKAIGSLVVGLSIGKLSK